MPFWALFLSLLVAPAQAAVPVCANVCDTPDSYSFPNDKVRHAVNEADRTFRVVVFETVLDQPKGPWSSGTERALEETWSSWAATRSAFDPESDVLIVLGIDDREVRIKTGSAWDADYGLWGDALLPFIDDHFLPRAKAGDLDGGLARLVTAIDVEVGRRVHAKEQADWRLARVGAAPAVPEVRVVGAPMSLPQTEADIASLPYVVVVHEQTLAGGTDRYGSSTEALMMDSVVAWKEDVDFQTTSLVVAGLDEGHVLVRPSNRWASSDVGKQHLKLARGATDADVDAALTQAIKTMEATYAKKQDALDALEAAEALREAERVERERKRIEEKVKREQTVKMAVAGTGVSAAVLTPIGGAGFWMVLVAAARRRFEEVADTREALLKQARENLDDLRLDVDMRERIVELKLKGPVTLQTLDDVGDAVATLHAGLDALDRQLRDVRSRAPEYPVGRATFDDLIADLSAELEIDTGEAQANLFDGPTRVIRVTPEAFMAELKSSFEDAREGWQRILDAVQASMHRADHDLPATDLEQMRAQLTEAGLPLTWLDTHPLVPSAEKSWARLDAIRVADPVHYLDELDAAIAEDDELEHIIAEIIGWQQTATEGWAEVREHSIDDLTTHFADPALDPRVMEQALKDTTTAFGEAMHSGHDLTQTRLTGEAVATGCGNLVAHLVEIRDAHSGAPDALTRAEAQVKEARSRRKTQAQELGTLLVSFVPESLADASRELREVDDDVAEAQTALSLAHAHLADSQHLEAARAAATAEDEVKQAHEDLSSLVAALMQAAADQAQAEELWSTIDTVRETHMTRLASLQPHSAGLDLTAGDAVIDELRGVWDTPANWEQRATRLQNAIAMWAEQSAKAASRKRAHEQEQARRRAAKAAAARRAASSHRSSSSRSSYKSSRSRSKSYSSSRSSKRSYSSSRSSSRSRSSGRSYSSGGRSAGRKW